MNLETRITHNPLQCGGKPCIRGMRIRVGDILHMKLLDNANFLAQEIASYCALKSIFTE